MHEEKIIFCGNNENFLQKELTEKSNKSNGGNAFRIPSIINAGGTLIAVADRQTVDDDCGYIELVVRTSSDGGESWSDIDVIASPPARKMRGTEKAYPSAFFVNPCLMTAPNGDVILIAEFHPECKDLHGSRIIDKRKIPYSMYEKRMRPLIYDRDNKFYIIRKDGVVLNSRQKETIYRVTDSKGSLYKGDSYAGNIYLNGKTGDGSNNANVTFGAPLKAPKRNYIFLFRSSDKGKSWSDPVDITPDFMIKDDGAIINVSSGIGLTTQDERIILPLYVNRKESVSVYSVDNGETWHRMTQQPYAQNSDEWQAVQAPDGIIFGVGRQKAYGKSPLSISYDNGKHWNKAKPTNIVSPKCQKSIISVGEYVFCSHPSEADRHNGVITVGKFKKAGGKSVGIDWYSDIEINHNYFAYSCLVQIDEEHIGVLYEAAPSSYICFKKYKISEII